MLRLQPAPAGRPFAEPLPAGVHDVGIEIWSQPDAFAAVGPADGRRRAPPTRVTGDASAELMEAAAAGSLLTDGGRLFSVTNPASPPGIATFTEPLARSGSLVLVRQPGPGGSQSTYDAERATDRV